MRCCLKTLDDAMIAATEPPKEGDVLHCAYHDNNGGMIFHSGVWRWNNTQQEIIGDE